MDSIIIVGGYGELVSWLERSRVINTADSQSVRSIFAKTFW